MRERTVKSNSFTLIEIIAAMGVFSIIMLILLSFFSSAQNIWSLSRQRSTMYENARIALDLIARDIQCIYYEQEKIPFYHHPGSAVANDTEALYFVSATNCPPNYDNNTRLCEIAYKFYNMDDTTPGATTNRGWLVRSVTGDEKGLNAKCNYYGTPPLGKVYDDNDPGDATYAFTRGNNSRDAFNAVIPYVVNLSFICYKNDVTAVPIGTGTPNAKLMFPYSVMIELTILDRESWLKWKAATFVATSPILLNNQRTFSRTVLIGERGQKY